MGGNREKTNIDIAILEIKQFDIEPKIGILK